MSILGAALHIIHGLWSAHQALCLWVEGLPVDDITLGSKLEKDGRTAISSSTMAALSAKAPLLGAALEAPSRSAMKLWLPTVDGALVPSTVQTFVKGTQRDEWDVPVSYHFPGRAHDILAELATLNHESARSESNQLVNGVALGDDLLFLTHVMEGLEALISRGRVVPFLAQTDEGWWGRWSLLYDAEVSRWLGEAAARMPASVRAEEHYGRPAHRILGDFSQELTDLLVRRRTAHVSLDLQHSVLRSPLLSWLTSLDTGEELVGWSSTELGVLAEKIDRWRSSAFAAPYELLLRIAEPAIDTEPVESLRESENDNEEKTPDLNSAISANGHAPAWTLELRLRSMHDPSLIMTVTEVKSRPDAPRDPMSFLIAEVSRAGTVYRPLLDLVAGAANSDLPLSSEDVLKFVRTGAPALLAAGFAVQLPARWSQPEVSLTLHAQTPELPDSSTNAVSTPARIGLHQIVDYSWKVALGDDILTADELAALAEAKSSLVRLRGNWVQVDQHVIGKALEFLTRTPDHNSGTFGSLLDRISGAQALPAPVSEFTASGWLGDLLSVQTFMNVNEIAPPTALTATLRPYQIRGLSWLAFMSHLGLGVILADDMGLGKTVQLLALLVHEQEMAAQAKVAQTDLLPTLLVCPMSVVGNWQRETAKFAPSLRVYVHHGTDRARGKLLQQRIAEADLVITTYALLARDIEELKTFSWGRITLDEAQHVKNSNTRQAKAARAIHAHHKVALTGTPVENRLDELRSLLDFANPGMLGTATGFRTRFANPIERDHDEAATARLRMLTSPFILRRVKTDPEVITDLPEKHEMTVRANLTAEQASLYQAVVDDMLARLEDADGMARRGVVLATLTKLKQVCNHPAQFLKDGSPVLRRGHHRSGKIALAEDLMDVILADDEKVLCFTQYREFGAILQPYLSERFDTTVPFLHGGVSRGKREKMVASFQSPEGPPILLLSLKAGGIGLNLTAATQVIHLDRWWNPAVEDQATDRAYRIGQHHRVQVRKLVCVGTLEERIDAMIAEKREVADLAVGAGENWISEMDNDQLAELITLSADAIGD